MSADTATEARAIFVEVHRAEASVCAAEAALALVDSQIGLLSTRMAAVQALAGGLGVQADSGDVVLGEADGADHYYTTSRNPLRSGRAFRDAARRGCFPSFTIKRQIAARKSDVHAWIESRRRSLAPEKATPQGARLPVNAKPRSADETLLAEFGLRATRAAPKATEET